MEWRQWFRLEYRRFCNQPQVVEFLVEEKGVDIDRQKGISSLWTALHHACNSGAYEAAKMLLQLGADPRLKTDGGNTPLDKCKTDKLRDLLKLSINDELPASPAKKETVWTLTSSCEVMSVRRLPDNSFRLTEIFNFESRRVTAITKDLKSGHLAQSILFFDEIPDTQFVHRAHEKLTELGGKADPLAIDRRPLNGKSPLSRP